MMPNTTAFAPMANASVETAATVKPGDLRNCRRANRTSAADRLQRGPLPHFATPLLQQRGVAEGKARFPCGLLRGSCLRALIARCALQCAGSISSERSSVNLAAAEDLLNPVHREIL